MSDFLTTLRINEIRNGDTHALVASDAERAEIMDRLGLSSLDLLEATVVLERDGDRVTAKGEVLAEAAQACIATGEPVPETVREPLEIHFVPVPRDGDPDEEVELEEGELDTVFHDGQSIELGNALADTLSLALDPYPRSKGADQVLRDAGVMSEEEAGPFGSLAELKAKLEKKSD